MSNIHWPRRPDWCNKDGRVCEKLPVREFRFIDADGNEMGWLYVSGDFGFMLKGVEVEERLR